MRIVIALGGNALLKRGEPMHYEVQRANVRMACQQIAKVLPGNELIITLGNGPQVGLIAVQQNAYTDVPMYPLDAIGAESVGMIGYMIARELTNVVPRSITVTNVLTQTEIDPNDPAFKQPTKPIGPIYTKEEAERLSQTNGWTMASDNDKFRRVVASPNPQRILGLSALKTLIENGHLVVCCGGGGVPRHGRGRGRQNGLPYRKSHPRRKAAAAAHRGQALLPQARRQRVLRSGKTGIIFVSERITERQETGT